MLPFFTHIITGDDASKFFTQLFEIDWYDSDTRLNRMCQIVFSDKSTIAILYDKMQTIRRKSGKNFLPDYLKKPVKFPAKISVWGQYQFIKSADYA